MAEPGRLTELGRLLNEKAIFPAPKYAVALSGGADSGALAAICADRDELKTCVHVHHGLPASDRLQSAAAEIAEALNCALETVTVEPPLGRMSEAEARDARYQAIATVVDDSTPLLVAHTRDDQAETVLLNLIRGAGTRGLAGIPYFRPPNVYRPLLDVSRSETREYATLSGLPFLDDPTNDDLTFRRNRVRTEIIPLLEELNPNLRVALARTADNLGGDADLLDSLVPESAVTAEGDEARVPAGLLVVLEAPIRGRVLRQLVSKLRGGGLAADELVRVEQVLFGEATATELEGQIRVTRNGAALVVRRTPE